MVFNALKLSKLLLAVLDIIQNTTYIQTKYNILFYYVIFFFFFGINRALIWVTLQRTWFLCFIKICPLVPMCNDLKMAAIHVMVLY